MTRLNISRAITFYGLSSLFLVAISDRALAASPPCTLDQVAGRYQTDYGPLTCGPAAAGLHCCYGDACQGTAELSLDSDGRSVSGTWKYSDGTDGRTTFPLTSDCQLSDGKWGWGQDAMKDGWRITAKPAPRIPKQTTADIPPEIALPPMHPDLASPPDIPPENQSKAPTREPLTEAAKAFLEQEKQRLNKALEENRRKQEEVAAKIEENKQRQAEASINLASVEKRIREICGGRICQLLAEGQIIYRTDTYDPPLWYLESGRLAPRDIWPK